MARKILIVEDNPLINDLIAETLTGQGHHCVSCFDGEAALQQFAAQNPDAVVLDLNIPNVHGLEVLKRLKATAPLVVVVVLTGHGSEKTAMQALRLGADEYLTKPFRHADLLEALEIHLHRADLQGCVDVPGGCPAEVEDQHLARVFFEAPAALVQVDGDGAMRAVNRTAARLLARAPQDLLGQPVAELVAPEVRSTWLDFLRAETAGVQPYEGEVHLVRGTGVFPAGVLACRGPDPEGLIVSLRDLTRQKAMEKRYYESKKLASLGRVVEGVAHEVRNPLISIGGFARKLRASARSDSREGRYLEVILAEVERLERMVCDIEGFVMFSTQNRPQFAPVELAPVMADAVRHAAGLIRSAGIQVQLDDGAKLPPIYADRGLVKELFDGLVENACEAMPGGGTLSIGFVVADNWVQTRVEDTGVGIEEARLDEVFDPFFTSKTSGAGLGLTKAYMIVEEHAGTIDFESRLGKGTICTVNLPADRRRVARRPS